jgi:hypothetical protein
MKSFVLFLLVIAGMIIAGCAHKEPKMTFTHAQPASAGSPAVSTNMPPMIVTPANSLAGKVVSYNAVGRFVVLNFPVGQMPAMDESLSLYRAGLKVADVKITGPQRDENIVADLVSGEAQVGDEVRDQ